MQTQTHTATYPSNPEPLLGSLVCMSIYWELKRSHLNGAQLNELISFYYATKHLDLKSKGLLNWCLAGSSAHYYATKPPNSYLKRAHLNCAQLLPSSWAPHYATKPHYMESKRSHTMVQRPLTWELKRAHVTCAKLLPLS
jgi:hypothetical protein